MITIICTAEQPQALPSTLTGISSQHPRNVDEPVQIEMANGTRQVLGFGRVTGCKPDVKWSGWYRYDVAVEG